ncbi:hypothetical protein BC828DRAFT_394089 [Blastocladiella britannica]|nr:hypothetical protein BC828DRAFT_394089 [Blastocladiella britannica]
MILYRPCVYATSSSLVGTSTTALPTRRSQRWSSRLSPSWYHKADQTLSRGSGRCTLPRRLC